MASVSADLKRKRSASHDREPAALAMRSAPPAKASKVQNSHLQINYLARQYSDDLPLVSTDDTLPSVLALLNEYQGVLERHESMAGNLGARPLGPILVSRFERLFDGPPRIIRCHGKDGTTVTWLDVIEFARNKPDQFQLGQMSEGTRVCQFYTKQCRVQISEEDFQLISSGIPQKMIPPQPIMEDEEKELGTLEILEKNTSQICQLADQVAARTRQINHRLKARKRAILDRRATEPSISVRPTSPSNVALMNGTGGKNANVLAANASHAGTSPKAGFVAVNAKPQHDGSNSSGGQITSRNTHNELMNKFHSLSDRWQQFGGVLSNGDAKRNSAGSVQASPQQGVSSSHRGMRSSSAYYDVDPSGLLSASTPAEYATGRTSTHASSNQGGRSDYIEKEDREPYKAEMVSRMEGLQKGDRVLPPCDRCRRLHMDCLKNLTACMGCTKKHAKCSWREVREEELMQSISEAGAKSEEDDSDDDNDDEQNDMDALEMVLAAEQEQAAAAALSQSDSGSASRSDRDADEQQEQQQEQQQELGGQELSHQLPQISLHQAEEGGYQQGHNGDLAMRHSSDGKKLRPASEKTQRGLATNREGTSAVAVANQKPNAEEQLQQRLREEQKRHRAGQSPRLEATHRITASEERHSRAENSSSSSVATAVTTTNTGADTTSTPATTAFAATNPPSARAKNISRSATPSSGSQVSRDGDLLLPPPPPLQPSLTSAPAVPTEMTRQDGSSIAVSPL